ncbi:MAG TPA: helix-turn-helix transcriptional regulator [Puia sp.]|nr:helix-turn-helix transcriptional regulator [Puia sp.]
MIAGFLNTLILLGALQGFIVCGLLVASARERPAERTSRRLLALLLFLIALACLDVYLLHCSFWNATMIGAILSAVLPLIVVMPMGPLIYFYTRSCIEPDLRLGSRDRRHFYPVVVDLFQHVASLVFILAVLCGLVSGNGPLAGHFGSWLDNYNQYSDIPRWISTAIYLGLATRYLRRNRHNAGSVVHPTRNAGDTEAAERKQRWPMGFLRVFWAFTIFWLLFLIPYELPRIGDALIDRFDWYPLYLPLVAIIYYLGVKGYFISYRREPDKKAGVAIPEEKLGPLIQLLKRSMEEDQLWLNADLNLSRLAQHCGAAPKLLSTVLNQHMDITFNDFVNRYRIDAVKERLQRAESRELTIAGLAYECGFNSLPTFQRAFKATTGMSPKEYMAGNCDQIRI